MARTAAAAAAAAAGAVAGDAAAASERHSEQVHGLHGERGDGADRAERDGLQRELPALADRTADGSVVGGSVPRDGREARGARLLRGRRAERRDGLGTRASHLARGRDALEDSGGAGSGGSVGGIPRVDIVTLKPSGGGHKAQMARVGADRNSAVATDASGVWRGRRTCAVAAADIDITKDAMVVVRVGASRRRTLQWHARSMRLCLITGEVQASSIPNCSRRSASETDG